MGKPSIFSKNYEKKMKIRRRNTAIVIVVIILFAVSLFLFGGIGTIKWSNIKSGINRWLAYDNKKNDSTQKKSGENSNTNTNTNANQTKKTAEEQKNGFDITMSDNTTVKAVYETKDNTKKFKYIEPVSSNIPYYISASGNAMILFDTKAQSITYVTIDGKINNVTKKDYTSTSGTVFDKDSVLKNNPNYIWCTSPAFIDDNNVAYISDLPWFDNRGIKYVWVVNIQNGTHKQILSVNGSDLGGQNVKFGTISEKGLGVTVDDKNYYIRNDGTLTE